MNGSQPAIREGIEGGRIHWEREMESLGEKRQKNGKGRPYKRGEKKLLKIRTRDQGERGKWGADRLGQVEGEGPQR